MHASPWLTGVIAAATIAGVALGRFPGLRMNRATIAMVGATPLLATGCLSRDQAFAAVDLPTLALLLGMMILDAHTTAPARLLGPSRSSQMSQVFKRPRSRNNEKWLAGAVV
jgi:hypothetical protein